jgi:TPR repeat protein
MYREGKGVTQDFSEAVKWFQKAVEQNYAAAQDNLGQMYETGHGVTRDFNEAAKWYRLAAERGYGGAQNRLAILYAQGRGVNKDLVEAYKWFALAETHGDREGADIRAALTNEMTSKQIAEAEKQVKGFSPRP